jgi:uncharacterized membrane protein
MSRSIIIIVLSFLTALFPHLGFPGNIKNIAVTVLALGIAMLGYMAYRDAKKRDMRERMSHEEGVLSERFPTEQHEEDTESNA